MKKEITATLSNEVRSQLDFLAQSLGQTSFFIQDTETTGTGELDQIHDFAGLLYDKGRIYQIQYYVVQPDDIDENGGIHVRFDEIKKANKDITAFRNMISNKDYEKLRKQMLNKNVWDENDPMITREGLANLLKNRYGKIPNFTYNAVFDIKMEKKLNTAIKGNIKFNEIYDVMTMSLDLMPEILSTEMKKELGKGKLEKVYAYLNKYFSKEFAKFKTTKTGAQTHTAWDDVFQYTVPVLNFMVYTLNQRGYKIQSYKNLQHYWNIERFRSMQEIVDNGLTIGLNLSQYDKKSKQYTWQAGVIGARNAEALQTVAMFNQMVSTSAKSMTIAVQTKQQSNMIEQEVTNSQLSTAKEQLRYLQAQKRKLLSSLSDNPRSSVTRKEVDEAIQYYTKQINKLETAKKALVKQQESLKQTLASLNTMSKIDTAETTKLKQQLLSTQNDYNAVTKKINKYISDTLKKYKGTPFNNKHQAVWDLKTGVMKFQVNGKITEVALPQWWGNTQAQRAKTVQQLTDLEKLIDQSRVNPQQVNIDKTQKQLQKLDKILLAYDQRLIQYQNKIAAKQKTEDALLEMRIKDVIQQKKRYQSHAKNGQLPPAYYAAERELQKLYTKLSYFRDYDTMMSNIANVNADIDKQKQLIKNIKKEPSEVKSVIYNGQVVQIGLARDSNEAYFLDKNGKLGRKVPGSIWDHKKGILKGAVQLTDYQPSRERFQRLTAKQIMDNPKLLDDMTIIPVKMGLYTGITKDGRGFLVRAHESKFLNAKEKAHLDTGKIYSVSELTSVLSQYFGKEDGAGWKTEFGTAHHKVIEDICNKTIKLKKNGTLDPQTLKRYLLQTWTHTQSTEERADLRALFDAGRGGKLNEQSFNLLCKTVNEYLKQTKELGLRDNITAEHTLGAQIHVGGKSITISGTLDQFWVMGHQVVIGDLKTSKEVSPQYVVQLSLYRALLKIVGNPILQGKTVSQRMKILLTPAEFNKYGNVVDIDAMSDKDLASFIFDAANALNEKNVNKKHELVKQIQDKWIPKLDSHISRRLVTEEVKIDNRTTERHFINGQSLSDIGEMLDKRCPMSQQERINWANYQDAKRAGHFKNLTYRQFLAMQGSKSLAAHDASVKKRYKIVVDYLNTITDPHERRHAESLLFMRGENSTFLYDSLIYNDYREYSRPELFDMIKTSKNGLISVNEAWLNRAKTEGFYKGANSSVTFGGLSVNDWLRLFSSVDLNFLYVDPVLGKTNVTKAKRALLSQANKMGSAYTQAVKALVDAVLYSESGLFQGGKSIQKAENFFALKSFMFGLQAASEKGDQLPKNFLNGIADQYKQFIKDHPSSKNISLDLFVREHCTKQEQEQFNTLRYARAANDMLNVAGMNSLLQLRDIEGNEMNDVLKASVDLWEQKYGHNENNLPKADFQLKEMQEMEETLNDYDSGYTIVYDTYNPQKKQLIMQQLAHRVARMLTRKALGDKIYTQLYNEFKTKYGGKNISYEQFLKNLPNEQYKEYLSSSQLVEEFNNAIQKGEANNFLVSLSNKTFIGSDTESRNLLSLIRSIKQQEPDILKDSTILKTIADQYAGAKMLHYDSFSYVKLARLGVPLTMVGKTLDESKKRSPYATFRKQNASLLKLFQSGKYNNFEKKLTQLLAKSLNEQLNEDALTETEQTIDMLLTQFGTRFPLMEELRDNIKEIIERTHSLVSYRHFIEEQNELEEFDRDLEELAEIKKERSFAMGARLRALLKVKDLFKFVTFYKHNFLGIGEKYGNLVGIEAVEALLNQEVADYKADLQKRNFLDTKQLHEALAREEADDMAKNDSETVQILKEILAMLQGGAQSPVAPKEVGGSADPIPFRASELNSFEVRSARALAKEEFDLEHEIINQEKKRAQALAKGESIKEIDGAITYLTAKHKALQAKNRKDAKANGSLQVLNLARQDIRTDYEGSEVEGLYASIFSDYIQNELNAQANLDKIKAQIQAAEKAKQLNVVEALNKNFLPEAQRRYEAAGGQTQEFLAMHPEFSPEFRDRLADLKEQKQRDYVNNAVLAEQTRADKTRLDSEKEYLKLLDDEKNKKEALFNIDMKLVGADAITATRLKAERQKAAAEFDLSSANASAAYSSYAANYGKDIDGIVHRLDGSVLEDPNAALADVTKVSKAKLREAKQKEMAKAFNDSAKEVLDLYKEIHHLMLQARSLRRNGNITAAEYLEGKDDGQGNHISGRIEELTSQYNTKRSGLDAQRKKIKSKKVLNSITDVEQARALLDADFELGYKQADDADFKRKAAEYYDLKKQELRLSDQLYRNNLKYNTTWNAKERGSLDTQAELLGMDLDDVHRRMQEVEEESKNLEGFAQWKEAKDERFSDLQAKNIADANVAFKGENTLFGRLTTSFKGMIYQFTQFGAAYKIIGSVKNGINQVITSAKNLDKVMTDLRIVTGGTKEETQQLMVSYSKLGNELSATTSEVAKAANDWLRQGYEVNEVNKLITASLYLSKLGMIDSATATERLTAVIKGFKLEAQDAVSIVDKLSKLDMSAAIDAGSIAEGLSQFAATGQIAGLGVDEAAALVTTIADVSQKSGSAVGNALRTIISRYGNVKSTKFSAMNIDSESEDTGENLNDVEKVLNKIGVSLRDTNLQFRDFDEVLDDLAKKWRELDSVSKRAVATAFAGVRQQEYFNVLMENYDRYKNFLEISENSAGTAERKYLSYTEQLQAAQNRLSASWEELAQNAEINIFLTKVTDFAAKLVKALPTILKWVTRIGVALNAYKLPILLNGLGKMTGVTGFFKGIGERYKEGGVKGLITPEKMTTEELEKYYSGQTGGLARISGILQGIRNVMPTKNDVRASKASGKASANNIKGDQANNSQEVPTAENKPSFLQKHAKGVATAATVAASTLTAVMTSGATHTDAATGEQVESSKEAERAMRVTSGVSTGLLGAVGGIFGGPMGAALGSTIGQFIGDKLGNLFGKMIDRERDMINARVKAAEDELSALHDFSKTIDDLKDTINQINLSAEDFQILKKSITAIRQEFLNNSDLLKQLANIMGPDQVTAIRNIYQTLNRWTELAEEEREQFINQLDSARSMLEASDLVAAQEKKIKDAYADLKQAGNSNMYFQTYDSLSDMTSYSKYGISKNEGNRRMAYRDLMLEYMQSEGHLADIIATAVFQGRVQSGTVEDVKNAIEKYNEEHWSEYGDMVKIAFSGNGEDIAAEYKNYIAFLNDKVTEITNSDNIDTDYLEFLKTEIQKYQDAVDQYAIAETELAATYRESNEILAQSAINLAKVTAPNGTTHSLLSASTSLLKELGKSGIEEIVTEQIRAQGGFRGIQIDSEEARSIIEQAIKADDRLYEIWTGGIYTLQEALNDQNTEVMKSFASALGVSIDELSTLADKLGTVKLSDILGTAADTRERVATITNLFTSMSNNSGLTAENMEKLVSLYPELVSYMGDSVALDSKLLQYTSEQANLYARQTMGDWMSNSGIFEIFKEQIKTENSAAYEDFFLNDNSGIAGNAKTFNDIMLILGASRKDAIEKYKITGETYDALQATYEEFFAKRIKSVMGLEQYNVYTTYWNKVWDKQIANLNEQKSALQDINKQREYENKLIEAQMKLIDASKEKQRVWREGVGWVYESSQAALAEAQTNLEEVKREQEISALDQQITELQSLKEHVAAIEEAANFEELEAAWKSMESNASKMSIDTSDIITSLGKIYDSLTHIETDTQQYATDQTNALDQSLKHIFGDSLGSFATAQEVAAAQAVMLAAGIKAATAKKKYGEDSREYQAAYDQYQTAKTQYQATQKSYENFTNYEMGAGSLWNDVEYARYQMARYSKDPYSTQYREWETKYNTALAKYQEGIKSFQNQYGAAGNIELENAWSKDQQNTYNNAEAQHKAQSYIYMMDGDKKYRYKYGSRASSPYGHKTWTNIVEGYDSIKDSKKDHDFDVQAYYPGQGYNADTRTVKQIHSPDDRMHHTDSDSDQIKSRYDGDLNRWANELLDAHPGSIVHVSDDENLNHWFQMGDGSVKDVIELEQARRGSLGLSGGPALINESGTEAIITPAGTLTALPSDTGIIPADITRNLWQLGALAPSIMRAIGVPIASSTGMQNSHIDNSDSLNIGTINMSVSADNSFDAEHFVQLLKQQASLTKNNKR